jgi:hypothetical protein
MAPAGAASPERIMTAEIPNAGTAHDGMAGRIATGSGMDVLRAVAITVGICWSVLFVVIGLRYGLQQYADGSMFSYAVAVQDSWAFHWHNISGRLLVYLITCVPAELYVELTKDARGGIVVYGFLFFVMPLAGLAATWAPDRSKGRIIFTYACGSTACLSPLVFGFPTEMWVAHALFWPTLAVCHYARRGIVGTALVFAMLLALVLTHEAVPMLAAVILVTLLLRGIRDAAFLRAACAFLVVIAIWILVKETLRPDDYDGPMMERAALLVFRVKIFTSYIVVLLVGALAGYGVTFLVLRRLSMPNAHLLAALLVAVALTAYWLWFDRSLHADQRYPMRTVILIAMAALAGLAAAYALDAEGRLKLRVPLLPRLMAALRGDLVARAAAGAILVVTLVHAVELAKFVRAWTDYEAAVRTLAMGTASDPVLGDADFVSSDRIGADLNRLSWFSTTQFLSVLVAPGLAPRRLVVDPTASYFWLSCATAKANEEADRAVPVESRRLVRVHACLHR